MISVVDHHFSVVTRETHIGQYAGCRATADLGASNKKPRPPAGESATDDLINLVGEGGLEPPRPEGHWHLKPARLPFRHSP
jgi:hypothetical protein